MSQSIIDRDYSNILREAFKSAFSVSENNESVTDVVVESGRGDFFQATSYIKTPITSKPIFTMKVVFKYFAGVDDVIFGSLKLGDNSRCYIGVNPGGELGGGVGNVSYATFAGGGVLVSGKTYTAHLTYDGATVRLYRDGSQVASTGGITSSPDNDLLMYIGALNFDDVVSFPANVSVYEASYYVESWTAEQVENDYKNQTYREPSRALKIFETNFEKKSLQDIISGDFMVNGGGVFKESNEGHVVQFISDGDHIDVGRSLSGQLSSGAYSFCAYGRIYVDNDTQNFIASDRRDDILAGIGFRFRNNNFQVVHFGVKTISTSIFVEKQERYFIFVTYDGSSMKFYKGTDLISTGTEPAFVPEVATNTNIGRERRDNTSGNGNIEKVIYWDGVVDDTTRLQEYQKFLDRKQYL